MDLGGVAIHIGIHLKVLFSASLNGQEHKIWDFYIS